MRQDVAAFLFCALLVGWFLTLPVRRSCVRLYAHFPLRRTVARRMLLKGAS